MKLAFRNKKEKEQKLARQHYRVIQLESSQKPRFADYNDLAAAMLAVVCMLTAATSSLRGFLSSSSELAFFVACLVALLLHQAVGPRRLFSARTRPQFIMMLVILAVGIIIFLTQFSLVWGGFAATANGIIDRFNQLYACYMPHRAGAVYSQAAGIMFVIEGGLLLGLASSILMQSGSKFVLPVVSFTLVTVGRYLSPMQDFGPIAMICFGVLLYFAALSGVRITGKTLVARTIAPCLVATFLFVLCTGYQPLSSIDDARDGFGATVRAVRYGQETLPEGDVAMSGSMNSGDEARLEVTADKQPANDVLLRGYVGASWDGRTWNPESTQAYTGKWEGLTAWLSGNGFDAQTQVARYDNELRGSGDGAGALNLDVDNLAAYRAFVYAPFALRGTDAGYETNHDAQIISTRPFGAKHYREQVADENPERLLSDDAVSLNDSEAAKSFGDAELVYRAFVQENFTAISPQDAAAAEDLIFDREWTDEKNPSLYTMVSRVRLMLSIAASYDSSATSAAGAIDSMHAALESTPAFGAGKSNQSFLASFLSKDHKGNSSCFATAAVLAFRSQGVPARYVEGYRLPVSHWVDNGEGAFAATARTAEAHAWVEVYRDGVGWLPVEVTPGFYTEMQTSQLVVPVDRNVQNSSGNDSQEDLVTGGVAEEEDLTAAVPWTQRPLLVALATLGCLLLLAALLFAALELQRAIRLRKLHDYQASSDQQLRVRAYFDDIALSLLAAGIPFDKGRPENFVAETEAAFPQVLREEYQRMVELVRKSVFGCKELKPHEMRALTSLAERLAEDVPERGLRRDFVNRYKYLR